MELDFSFDPQNLNRNFLQEQLMTRVRGNLKSQEMFRNVPTFETHIARLPLGIIYNWCQSGELAQIRANGIFTNQFQRS